MRLSCRARAGVAELDPLVAGADLDDAFDENAGGMDMVRIDLAGRHQMLDLGVFNIDRKGGGMTLIELAPGTSLDEVKSKTEANYRVALKNN